MSITPPPQTTFSLLTPPTPARPQRGPHPSDALAEAIQETHSFGAFKDANDTIHPITFLADGSFMRCYNITGRPNEVFKAFLPSQIDSNQRIIPIWTRNKNEQYQALLAAGISVANTYPVTAGWVQEKCVCTLASGFPEELLPQVQKIIAVAWKNKIHIDGLPRNFGYDIANVVKLFDFREEPDLSDLECDLNRSLREFDQIHPGSAETLDPRLHDCINTEGACLSKDGSPNSRHSTSYF